MSYPNSENFYNKPRRIVRRFSMCSDDDLSFFTITNVGAGTARTTVEDANGGTYALTGDSTTDNAGAQIQSKAEFVALMAEKPVLLRTVFNLEGSVVQSDHIIGWAITDTTLVASAPSDGMFLVKDDDESVWDFWIRKASGTAVRVTGVFAADLLRHTVTLEIRPLSTFATDGKCKVWIYLDGAQVFGDSGGGDRGNNIFELCPTTELALSYATQNGDGVTRATMNIHDIAFDVPEAA